MAGFITQKIKKLYFKKWIIGVFRGDLEEIIRSKTFDPQIKWLWKRRFAKFYADPFILSSDENEIKVLIEEFPFKQDYGKLALMKLDKNFRQTGYKIILDTGSHLSYPFFYKEDGRTFVFPEAGQSGKFSCYEFNYSDEKLHFVKDILDVPLLDSTIIKRNGKYWIFGAIGANKQPYKLFIYYSDNLLGPYSAHPMNPVKADLDGSRPAGNMIEVDGVLYRPAQNCRNIYGESMTVNKIISFDETRFEEVPYMTISINKDNVNNKGVNTIHTINALNGVIVVDGIRWTFAPIMQIKSHLDNRKKEKRMKMASSGKQPG